MTAWAAGGPGAAEGERVARKCVAGGFPRRVVLVEGASDLAALEALAARRGLDPAARGCCVVPMGGATSLGRFLRLLGPRGLGLDTAGLCDAGEEEFFGRALESAGIGPAGTRAQRAALGFQVCVADLEDELIRALGTDRVCQVIDALGDLRALRIFQKQPAQRGRSVERQLRRFLGTTSGRKARYARALTEALPPDRIPRPLDRLLTDALEVPLPG